jgi:hypothetical protein
MATIYNSDLSREIVEGGKIQTSVDRIPSELAEKVIPVMEVNPKLLRKINVVKYAATGTSTGVLTIYTTPSDRDFYLCSICAGYIKDATCDMGTGRISITATPFYEVGVMELIGFPTITLTAQERLINVDYSKPILLKRGTTIAFAVSFTAGVLSRTANITGYTIDNSTA